MSSSILTDVYKVFPPGQYFWDKNFVKSGKFLRLNWGASERKHRLKQFYSDFPEILTKQGFNLTFIESDQNFEFNNWSSTNVDAVLAPTTISDSWFPDFFKSPMIGTVYKLSFLTCIQPKAKTVFNYASFFEKEVWICLAISVLIVSLFQHNFRKERKFPFYFKNKESKKERNKKRRKTKRKKSLFSTIWKNLFALINVQKAKRLEVDFLVDGMYLLMATVLTSLFSSSILASLFHSPKTSIESFEELINSDLKLIIINGSGAFWHIRREKLELLYHPKTPTSKLELISQLNERLVFIEDDKRSSVLESVSNCESALLSDDKRLNELKLENPSFSIKMADDKMLYSQVGMRISLQSSWKSTLCLLYQKCFEFGIIQYWDRHCLSLKLLRGLRIYRDSSVARSEKIIATNHLFAEFLLLAGVFAFSCFCLVVESNLV